MGEHTQPGSRLGESKARSLLMVLFLLTLVLLNGCAQMRTSRLTVLKEPEFYLGPVDEAVVKPAALPIQLQNFRHPLSAGLQSALRQLRDSLNTALRQHLPVLNAPLLAMQHYPQLYLGVSESEYFPGDPEAPELQTRSEQEKPVMVWYVEQGSGKWREAIGRLCAENGYTHLVVVFVGLSDFKVFQRDWQGRKEVRLGSDYTQPVPWLTSLRDPVEVVYLAGALVNARGKVVRVGAEALLAKPSHLLTSAAGLETAIRAGDVEQLLTRRREDRIGRPPVWRHALSTLLSHLLHPDGGPTPAGN